ncbi:MAG TPA: phosphoserine phosphatase SerB [Casimicrobiaceae bacterium]
MIKIPRDAAAGSVLDLIVQAPLIVREDLAVLAALTDAQDVEPLTDAATEAYRLHNVAQHDGVEDACVAMKYDFALVPQMRTRERVRLVALDMDSTLITIECIDEIADMRGIKPQIAAITERAMRGEIDFRESLTRRVELLAGMPVAALERVYADRVRLSPGAQAMLRGFKAAGAKTLLVSGGFTFFTERLKTLLGFDYALGNDLEIIDDTLAGRVAGDIVDAQTKARTFKRVADEHRGFEGITVAIGDGANDLPMLGEADVAIAYHAKPKVRAQATHAIDYCGLDAVLNLFA